MIRVLAVSAILWPTWAIAEAIVIDGARSIKVGAYTLVLNGATATIDTDTNRITIGPVAPGPVPPGPTPPVPPQPDPPTPPDLPELAQKAFRWTLAVNRPALEKREFAAAYRKTASSIRAAANAGVEITPQQCVKLLAEEVGALATPEFRQAWDAWSKQYKAAMEELKLSTAKQHADAWDQIAQGLEAASQ